MTHGKHKSTHIAKKLNDSLNKNHIKSLYKIIGKIRKRFSLIHGQKKYAADFIPVPLAGPSNLSVADTPSLAYLEGC